MDKPKESQLRCLIIDDEAFAHEVIKSHLNKIDKALLVGQCFSGIEAYNIIIKEKIDLIFLDINMPELSGLDLLRNLDHPPKAILTTAHSEYAIEGYDLNVIDYLLKPISFPRFLKAFNKVLTISNSTSKSPNYPLSIEVKIDGVPHRINSSEIEFIEGVGNYVRIHLKEKRFLTQGPLIFWLDKQLPIEQFCRIHRSFIINLEMIEEIRSSALIMKSGTHIPIGRQYKELLHNRVQNLI
ncbi:MAG: LytR/AlgR family response regulator transcription factor [Flavobacteriales bacterium]